MDDSWEKWFSDLEMEEDELHLLDEHSINSLEEELMKGESSLPCDSDFANNSNMDNASCLESNTHHANSDSDNQISSSYTLSFEEITVIPNVTDKSSYARSKQGRKTSQCQEHIMAERKRRQKISTMLIELSAIVPGLKRLDKLSILSNTIDYVKCLQDRVKDLQEQNNKTEYAKCRKNKNHNVNVVGEKISGISNGLDRVSFPIVDASVSGKDVLIRVICEKREHILTKLLSKIASLNLSIVCTNVLPFGSSTITISVIAKVEHELSMAIDDLVEILNEDLLKFYNLEQ